MVARVILVSATHRALRPQFPQYRYNFPVKRESSLSSEESFVVFGGLHRDEAHLPRNIEPLILSSPGDYSSKNFSRATSTAFL
jgi:hypothetical protein